MAQPAPDYHESPRRYAELGVDELVVFDPFPGPDRVTFTVYRRDETGLSPVRVTQDPVIHSNVLGCHIRKVGEGAQTRLRIATGNEGQVLVPTSEEAAEAERVAKEAALERVAQLEAELKRRQ